MNKRILAFVLSLICILSGFLFSSNSAFAATETSYHGDWFVQNHLPTEGSYVTDSSDGSLQVITSGNNMLELIRYPDVKSGSDVVTLKFGMKFDDINIKRVVAIRGINIDTHNTTAETGVLSFGIDGNCRVGTSGGDTFAYELDKWYDFEVNVFLRTGHIVATVKSDLAVNEYDGYLATKMYDLWRLYFINYSTPLSLTTSCYIRNFSIICTPYLSSSPKNGETVFAGKRVLSLDFPVEIDSFTKILLNGKEIDTSLIQIDGSNVKISADLKRNTNYNLSYRGLKNSYGDVYTGSVSFVTADDIYVEDIAYFADEIEIDAQSDNEVVASVTINSQSEKQVSLISALYDKNDGKIENVSVENIDLSIGENKCIVSVKPKISGKNKILKVFLWNENLSPVKIDQLLPFERPSGKEVLDDLFDKTAPYSHPRLYATPNEFENIKAKIQSEPMFAEGFEKIKREADSLLSQEPYTYEIPDGTRLAPAHNMRPRIQALGLTYAVTGDEKYAERLWRELESACDFPDWNPRHFLDVGVLMVTFAEGFDWAYDYISKDEAKVQKLVNALETKGFEPLLDDYLDRPRSRTYNWAQAKKADNWNVICNAGGIMASLSFAEYTPDYAGQILGYALPLLEKSVIYFAPDGAWFEGLSYWSYMMKYYTDILSGLNTAIGNDYGFSKVEGFDKTGYFPFNMSGPGGTFNFSNSGISSSAYGGEGAIFLLANVLGDKKLEALNFSAMKNKGLTFDYEGLIWYKGDFAEKDVSLLCDAYYRDTEVCALKGDGVFVALRGGSNSVAHSHLDTGSFVLDMEGVRFATDLGKEDYTLSTTYVREKYRERAEGHNTLVMNPDINPDQIESSFAKIDAFVSKEDYAFAICDMTDAYADDAYSAVRGIKLGDNRQSVTIQDDVIFKEKSELWWFMHTAADVTIADNKKSAVLTRNGKKIKAEILGDGYFSVMSATPLETSPQNAKQNKNSGYQKLCIHRNYATSLTVCVRFSPLDFECASNEIIPLSQWE